MPARPAPAPPGPDLAAIRAEIDALDDALHDLLMRRAAVVARLADSRAKGEGPALRPGREAAILRRLLGRHAGALPRAALVRLWRQLLAATTAMQGGLVISTALAGPAAEVLRDHMGLGTPLLPAGDEAAAIADVLAGRAALAAVPAGGAWWRLLDPARLQAAALLPVFGPAAARVVLLSPAAPDPSGEDRTLARLPEAGAAAALAAAGLPGARLAFAEGLALADLPGFLAAEDPRLAAAGAVRLGAHAVPIAG